MRFYRDSSEPLILSNAVNILVFKQSFVVLLVSLLPFRMKKSAEIWRRHWAWNGHAAMPYGKDAGSDYAVALAWAPEGTKGGRRANTTWRRIVAKKRNSKGWLPWEEPTEQHCTEKSGMTMFGPCVLPGMERFEVQATRTLPM